MKSNKAFRFDHVESIAAIESMIENSNLTSRTVRLSILYGARVAMVSGGIPESHITRLDSMIVFYERNRDLEHGKIKGLQVGKQKAEDSGRGF